MAIDRTAFNALVNDDGSNTTGTIWDKSAIAGSILDPVDALVGGWTTYSPTWTNLTIGNGTVSAKRAIVNDTVFWRIVVVFGSTSAISGSVSVTTPTNNTAAATALELANGVLYDSSSGQTYPMKVLTTGPTTGILFTAASPMSGISATVPFTWAVGDQIGIVGVYEKA